MQGQIRREFHDKHGPDRVLFNGWFIYPDGAVMEESVYGSTKEPPADPVRRAELLVTFRRVKLDQAVDRFDKLKYVLKQGPPIAQRVNGVDVNVRDPIKQLTALKDEAHVCKGRLDAAEAAYRELTPHKQQEIISEARRVEEIGDFKAAVEAVSI